MESKSLPKINAPRLWGVVYDVGLNFTGTGYSVEPFNPALVKQDMHVIASQLHATAIRIEGEDVSRLVLATRAAHDVGLAVYFNPWKMNATAEEARDYLLEAADAAEQLRSVDGVDVVFLVGCEYTIFSKGCFPGDTFAERVTWFGTQLSRTSEASLTDPPQAVLDQSVHLNKFLQVLVEATKKHFGGPISYSAGSWERVDWNIFDIVGIDHYRRGESAEDYVNSLDKFRLKKPLVVMEVGCCAYEGAGSRGDGGFALMKGVNPDGSGIFENDSVPTRSETEQADYIEAQLGLLQSQDLQAAFVYLFSFPSFPAGEGDRDLDMMAFSLVKTFHQDDVRSKAMPPWEPKEAFHRLAGIFDRFARTT
ncbi:hypothetical protein D0869_01374 [Hortaea werneckii]|uniref:Abortive infection protein n=1 Tax=Hortaea werneckii TaxID=91943 RepID=A0A3M6XD73_HORWE|nr:hypothetical protein KC324_g230 [Hortaea werneckii]KAI7595941.1 hypothetical protein KC316_g175 [Hortaea werneckii]RMX88784.1 hypothetical protein D0869_01374 [Hortaea werneckii]